MRIFPDKPVTIRPTETRMGSGKGSPEYWVAVVKPGRILYEMSGVSETVARAAISIAASKMPIRSQFLRLEIYNPQKGILKIKNPWFFFLERQYFFHPFALK